MRDRLSTPWLVLIVLSILCLVTFAASLMIGSVTIPVGEVFASLGAGIRGHSTNPIIWDVRVPRALSALTVGAILGASGATYQGLFRNPLADPYLMGAASGAAFGATIAMFVLGATTTGAWSSIALDFHWSVPSCAFAFGLGAVLLALLISRGAQAGSDLILAGVVVSAVLTGMTTWIMMLDPARVHSVIAFTLGSMGHHGWSQALELLCWLFVTLPLLVAMGRILDAMQLGDDVMVSMGFQVERLRIGILVAATIAVTAAVAKSGIIGFVGLIAPHIVRTAVGGRHSLLIVSSAVAGAILLGLSDLVARTVIAPGELPIGVITTLLGGPFFLILFWRQRRAR